MNYIYFDNASTSVPNDRVVHEYNERLKEYFNPSSLYAPSIAVKQNIESVRAQFLTYFNAPKKSTMIFTASASESNNTVLKNGIRRKDRNAVITMGEHASVYNTAMEYKNNGYDIRVAKLLPNGTVDTEHLYSLVDENTTLVSVIHVNNETGAVNDIDSISREVKRINPKILFHSDGVQAFGKVKIDLSHSPIDFYTISAHKVNGLRGVAGLYVGCINKYIPYILGGEQENTYRAGTENYASIMSFGQVLSYIDEHVDYQKHKDSLLIHIHDSDYKVISDENCVPNIICICFRGVRAETLQSMLADKGYLVGIGSACHSRHRDNRVLKAMHIDDSLIEGSIRISFDNSINEENIIGLAETINSAVCEYRTKVKK